MIKKVFCINILIIYKNIYQIFQANMLEINKKF